MTNPRSEAGPAVYDQATIPPPPVAPMPKSVPPLEEVKAAYAAHVQSAPPEPQDEAQTPSTPAGVPDYPQAPPGRLAAFERELSQLRTAAGNDLDALHRRVAQLEQRSAPDDIAGRALLREVQAQLEALTAQVRSGNIPTVAELMTRLEAFEQQRPQAQATVKALEDRLRQLEHDQAPDRRQMALVSPEYYTNADVPANPSSLFPTKLLLELTSIKNWTFLAAVLGDIITGMTGVVPGFQATEYGIILVSVYIAARAVVDHSGNGTSQTALKILSKRQADRFLR